MGSNEVNIVRKSQRQIVHLTEKVSKAKVPAPAVRELAEFLDKLISVYDKVEKPCVALSALVTAYSNPAALPFLLSSEWLGDRGLVSLQKIAKAIKETEHPNNQYEVGKIVETLTKNEQDIAKAIVKNTKRNGAIDTLKKISVSVLVWRFIVL